MLRITRTTDSGATTLHLSGRIGAGYLADLRGLIAEELDREVVLDLGEVSLVDVEVIGFLQECETHGIRLTRCPGYIHEWMNREGATGGSHVAGKKS